MDVLKYLTAKCCGFLSERRDKRHKKKFSLFIETSEFELNEKRDSKIFSFFLLLLESNRGAKATNGVSTRHSPIKRLNPIFQVYFYLTFLNRINIFALMFNHDFISLNVTNVKNFNLDCCHFLKSTNAKKSYFLWLENDTLAVHNKQLALLL